MQPNESYTYHLHAGKVPASTIRVNSDLVLVSVWVTDPLDRLVTGLSKEDFRLYEDQAEQEITQFAFEDAPVSVTLVFDTSRSMGAKLSQARQAVAAFLRDSNQDDDFSLIEFNDHARLLVHFTDQIEDIHNRLLSTVPGGSTALLDAIYLAVNNMKHARHARKAILIISDGGDNCSRYTEHEVMRRVREAGAQIYSIGIMEPIAHRGSPEEVDGPVLLDKIARQSGGRLYEVADWNDMTSVAHKIGTVLRTQYVLGYSPSTPRRDGRYHRIGVRLWQPKGTPKLRAAYRSGYIAPPQ